MKQICLNFLFLFFLGGGVANKNLKGVQIRAASVSR